MWQDVSLKSERNNPWFKPWLQHKQSFVCATVKFQCSKYLGYKTLPKTWKRNVLKAAHNVSKLFFNTSNRPKQSHFLFKKCLPPQLILKSNDFGPICLMWNWNGVVQCDVSCTIWILDVLTFAKRIFYDPQYT